MQDKRKIELRSEEVQEVMNHIPSAILRYGILVLSIILFILLLGSYWFKYPDIVSAEITLSTETPPVYVLARATGKIECINVEDKQNVKANAILGVIENTAVTDDVLEIQRHLDTWKTAGYAQELASQLFLSKSYQLGEVQSVYSSFISALGIYLRFYEQNYYKKKIQSGYQLLRMHEKYSKQLDSQHSLVQESAILNHNMYRRDSTLYYRNAMTISEFEESGNLFLQNKQVLISSEMSLIQNDIQKKQSIENLMDLERQAVEEEESVKVALKNAMEQLLAQLVAWRQSYLLQSPIAGKVTLMSAWSVNQNVESGETVFVVAPLEESKSIGKALLPIQGSGKVKAGQRVNVRLDNYPDQEFGYVSGVVSGVSPVPTAEDMYLVRILLPEGLLTNYGKILPLTRDMKGTADIITDDLSLIERFIQPLRKIVKESF